MKEYEIVWEILNECPNNQMRDVFFEERMVEDPEGYVREKLKGKDVSWEMEELADGSLVFHVNASGILERFTFTEI